MFHKVIIMIIYIFSCFRWWAMSSPPSPPPSASIRNDYERTTSGIHHSWHTLNDILDDVSTRGDCYWPTTPRSPLVIGNATQSTWKCTIDHTHTHTHTHTHFCSFVFDWDIWVLCRKPVCVQPSILAHSILQSHIVFHLDWAWTLTLNFWVSCSLQTLAIHLHRSIPLVNDWRIQIEFRVFWQTYSNRFVWLWTHR